MGPVVAATGFFDYWDNQQFYWMSANSEFIISMHNDNVNGKIKKCNKMLQKWRNIYKKLDYLSVKCYYVMRKGKEYVYEY